MKKYLVISVIALVLLLLWAYSNRNNKQIETSSGKTSSANTTSSKASSSSQDSEQASLQETSSSSIEVPSSEDTSEPAAESSGSSMNEEEIKNGDYSSIAGTWKSGTGNTLVFDANGLVSETQHLSEYGAKDMYGFVSIGVQCLGLVFFFIILVKFHLNSNKVFQVSQELQEHGAGFKFLAGLRERPLAKYGQIVVNLVQEVSGGIFLAQLLSGLREEAG